MSALNTQIGGLHYKKGIQPVQYIYSHDMSFFEGNVVKYVTRHKEKNGAEDIKKIMHYCQMILEFDYDVKSTVTFNTEVSDGKGKNQGLQTGEGVSD